MAAITICSIPTMKNRISLPVPWIRLCVSIAGTRVWSLLWELKSQCGMVPSKRKKKLKKCQLLWWQKYKIDSDTLVRNIQDCQVLECSFYEGVKNILEHFPGDTVGWNPSVCQRRGHGFDPWSRKIPNTSEQLSLCSTTTALEPELCKREAIARRSPQIKTREHSLLLATRESPCSKDDPVQPKISM